MKNSAHIRAKTVLRFIVGACIVAMVIFIRDASSATIPVLVAFTLCLLAYRLDFTNIWVAFALPWLMILGYSAVDISDYSRPVSLDTLLAIVMVLSIGYVLLPAYGVKPVSRCSPLGHVDDRAFRVVLLGYVALSLLNIILAGYIPLVRSVLTGDSGYMDFGVKGLYGLYNAFANSFGLTAFYFWMIYRDRKLYRNTYFFVLSVFLLFVTRQNMISLMVESFIVYCLVVRRVSGLRILCIASVGLVCFAMLGDFRVGKDIAEIAAIRSEYLWLPRAFIWLFAYCYFNLLNLDNVVMSSPQPAFDGGSFSMLVPSFMRPVVVEDSLDLLEVSSFTVDSFISPIYRDIGLVGLALILGLFCLGARWYIRRRRLGDLFIGDTGYAVLYFCFLFSFFVNFWFYLPIIFQLAFLPLFRNLLLRRVRFPTDLLHEHSGEGS